MVLGDVKVIDHLETSPSHFIVYQELLWSTFTFLDYLVIGIAVEEKMF